MKNNLDLNINFQDFISDNGLTKDDLKFLRMELKEMKDEYLIAEYRNLKSNEKELSRYNQGVLEEIINELNNRNISL